MKSAKSLYFALLAVSLLVAGNVTVSCANDATDR